MENTVNKKYHNKLGVGIYHLDPRWCSPYDFNRVANYGMVNAFRLTAEAGSSSLLMGCRRARETGEQIWFSAPTFFPNKESLSEFMARLDKSIATIKKYELWDTVVGFQWDEPLLKKGHNNEDFLAMTKAISEEYGKRIFPVFSGYEVMGRKGNLEDNDGDTVLRQESTKYITDVAFDLYGYDFRVPLREEDKKRYFDTYKQEFNTAEEFLQFYTDNLIGRMQNPDSVRLWYFTCAYLCRRWVGGPLADEDFCIQSLEGFKDLLLRQKNPGGLFTYGYKSWGDRDHLDWQIDEDNPNRWERYIEAAVRVCNELRDIDLKEER